MSADPSSTKRELFFVDKIYMTAYGGCEGPDAAYVKLISSDGHEFIIKKARRSFYDRFNNFRNLH